MRNLILVGLTAILASPALANHWNFECPFGERKINVRINNKKAKLIAPFAKGVFTFTNKGEETKVYKGKTDEGDATLLAPNIDFTLDRIPMGEKAEFTYEVAGPAEAMILSCETRPTLQRDPDLK